MDSIVDTDNEIAQKAEDYLQGFDPAPFAPPAFFILKGKINQYIADLSSESLMLRNERLRIKFDKFGIS